MKKNTLFGGIVSLPQNSLKKILLSCFAMMVMLSSYAATITANAVTGNWNAVASWSGGVVPLATDQVIIPSGATITVTAAATCAGITFNGGTLQLNTGLTVNGPWVLNSGTFTPNAQTVTFGTGGSIGGTAATTFGNVTINTTSSTDIVSLLAPSTTIENLSGGGGILTLTNGVFNIGTGHTLNFNNNSSTNGLVNNGTGGSLATTNGGQDGGTVVLLNGSDANFNITGAGSTTFYNLSFGIPYSVGAGNRTVIQSAASTVIISDTLYMGDNQCKWNTNSPIYTANATLDINNNNQQYTPGAGNRLEWLQLASGTPGVTKGYPNNVIIANVGTSASNYNTNQYGVKLSGTWAINGTLQIGTASATGFVDLDNGGSGANSFSTGGIDIANGKLAGPNNGLTVNGNWTRSASGTYISNNNTVTFGGNGTCASPNTITGPASETFYGLAIDNGAYVKLNSPVTVTNTLALSGGIFDATTNALSVTNTSTSAVTGGSATSYVNGQFKWSLQAAAGTYIFPVGSNAIACTNDYLPFTLNKVASSAVVATVQAFAAPSNGIVDATMSSLIPSEYWSLTTSASLSTGSTVAVSSPSTAIAPYTLIAESNSGVAAGSTFTSIGGTASTYGVINSNNIGATLDYFFTLGAPPIVSTLAATSITTTSATLNGAFNTQGTSLTTSFNYGTTTGYGTSVPSQHTPINSTTSVLDSALITGLTANTVYDYIATDGANSGSNVTFVTAPNPPVVGTPNTPTATGFTATWSAPAAMGSAPYTYTIEVSTDPTFATGVTTQSGISSASTSYTFTTLNSATQYYYRVEAVNATASSVWSATSTPLSTLIVPTSNACTTGSGSSTSPGSIPFAYTAPVVNGQADSIWNAIPANNISNVSVGSALPGVSQTWKALWTADSLYFLIQVTDPGTLISQNLSLPNSVLVPGATPGTSTNYYDFDGVEITLAPDGILTPGYNGVNDVQFRFNLGATTVSGQSCGCATQFSGTIFNRVAPHIDFQVVVIPGVGYNVEAAIPFGGPTGLNPGIDSSTSGGYFTPTVGASIGLETQVNDATSTAGRTTQYSWANSANNAYSDPQDFALAALTKCSTPPIVVLPTVTNITANGATLGATVTSGGDATTLTARGTGITASPDTTGTANALPEGGTAISIYSGPARTGLAPQTKYYFLGYAINTNNETGISNVDSFYTLSALPATQPTLSAPACGSNTLTLSWSTVTFPPTSQATNTGYLLLRRQDGTDPTTTGISTRIATVQSALPSGTTLVATIPGSATTYTDATAVSGTIYNYLLVPYTWDGVTADSTYNYLTAAAPGVVAGIGAGTTPIVTIGSISSPVDLGTPIPLVGNTTVAGTASWTVTPSAPIADTSSLSTTSTPTTINSYTYTLTVNASGCVGSARTTVNVVNAGCLIIPNAFTPNGDGFNDTWVIQSSCYTNLTVDVYDRWGSLMYHSDNYTSANAWDGKYQGKNVPDATYYYVVKATSATDSPTKKGSLTILR
jgi:gliding motility-associated-like protein